MFLPEWAQEKKNKPKKNVISRHHLMASLIHTDLCHLASIYCLGLQNTAKQKARYYFMRSK